MFDTIVDLPLHPLVVHAVVVLLPLMSLVTAAVAIVPRWRRAAAAVVVADALVAVATFVAKESGEKFQHRLSALRGGQEVAHEHAERGELLPYFAIALLVAAVLVWLARRSAGLAVVAAVVAVVAGVAAIGWTVVVGDSGARDTWDYVVTSTPAASGQPS